LLLLLLLLMFSVVLATLLLLVLVKLQLALLLLLQLASGVASTGLLLCIGDSARQLTDGTLLLLLLADVATQLFKLGMLTCSVLFGVLSWTPCRLLLLSLDSALICTGVPQLSRKLLVRWQLRIAVCSLGQPALPSAPCTALSCNSVAASSTARSCLQRLASRIAFATSSSCCLLHADVSAAASAACSSSVMLMLLLLCASPCCSISFFSCTRRSFSSATSCS
jgi:hypothetical protein